MTKHVLTFGSISGVIISVFMSLSIAWCYANNTFEGSMLVGYMAMIVSFSFIFVGIKNYRDKQQAGLISFGKAFKLGLLIALVASTLYVIAWAISYNTFFPDFDQKFAEVSLAKARAKGAAEYAETVKQINMIKDAYKSPVMFTFWTYMEILPVGIIVALIAAGILKRRTISPAS